MMYLQQSRPASRFSDTNNDREVIHEDVSGIKIKVKIVPHETSASKAVALSQREGEARSCQTQTVSSFHTREATAATISSSSSKKTLQEHPHQDSITTRVLPTAKPTRTSIAPSQRTEQRQSHTTTPKHAGLEAFKSAHLTLAEDVEELFRQEAGIFRGSETGVDGKEDLHAQVFDRLRSGCFDLSGSDVGLDEVFGLINALMPKNGQ